MVCPLPWFVVDRTTRSLSPASATDASARAARVGSGGAARAGAGRSKIQERRPNLRSLEGVGACDSQDPMTRGPSLWAWWTSAPAQRQARPAGALDKAGDSCGSWVRVRSSSDGGFVVVHVTLLNPARGTLPESQVLMMSGRPKTAGVPPAKRSLSTLAARRQHHFPRLEPLRRQVQGVAEGAKAGSMSLSPTCWKQSPVESQR